VGIEYLIILAGSQNTVDPNLGLGVVLVAFVLLVPQGIVPMIRDKWLPARQPAPPERPAARPVEAGQ
jgi:branched-chain amino acid transport system permease protein